MSDFIREVDEDYRRDRFLKFFQRYQVPLAAAVALLLLGSGMWSWWRGAAVTAAEQQNVRFQAAVDLAKAGKGVEAQAAFDGIAKDGAAGYALLARLRSAETLAARDPEAAAKAFDVVAVDDNVPASLRDTARVRGALLRVDHEDRKAFESRYGRFTIPGFAYHNTIRELLALTALKAGDGKAAERYLDDIVVDPGAPTAVRNRAEAFRLLAASGKATASATQPGPASVTPAAAAAPVGTAAPPVAPVAPAPPPE